MASIHYFLNLIIAILLFALPCYAQTDQENCALSACVSVLSDHERAAAVDELTDVIEEAINTWVRNDFDRYYENYAEDAVILGPAFGQDVESAKADLKKYGISIVSWDDDAPRYIRLSPDGMSAVVHYPEFEAVVKDSEGTEYPGKWAETNIWWKIDGTWKMVHVHSSKINTQQPENVE